MLTNGQMIAIVAGIVFYIATFAIVFYVLWELDDDFFEDEFSFSEISVIALFWPIALISLFIVGIYNLLKRLKDESK